MPTTPSFVIVPSSMINAKHLIDELADAVSRVFPESLARESERNLRGVLTATLARLDLVTREELEVQEQVLARTRAKLRELEAKLAELEEKQKG